MPLRIFTPVLFGLVAGLKGAMDSRAAKIPPSTPKGVPISSSDDLEDLSSDAALPPPATALMLMAVVLAIALAISLVWPSLGILVAVAGAGGAVAYACLLWLLRPPA